MQMLMWGMAALVSVTGAVGNDSRPVDGFLDGERVVLRLADGVRCEGSLLKMGKGGGMGSLTCADGRKGSFNWSYTGRDEATGDGWLAGESLTLTFTKVETPTQF
jgi:hypothetical protein